MNRNVKSPTTSAGEAGGPRARRRGAVSRKLIIALVCLAVPVGAFVVFRGGTGRGVDPIKATRAPVKRGNLTLSILQSGELESKRSESIMNDTDREAKILSIVDDGSKVQKGEVLFELESEELTNRQLQTQSQVSSADAELKNAQEDLEIKRLKQTTDLETAKLKVEVARLELKKYMEAEYPQSVDKARLDITIAKEELARSRDKLEWSKKLVEGGYVNRQELETNQLEVQRKEIEVTNKEADLKILEQYTHIKEQKELENAVATADSEVDRLVKSFASETARSQANLESKKTSLEVQRRQLKKIEEQVENTKVLSKWDGQVFYPMMRPWDNRKIEKGASVYPRQQILQFPDLTSWNIKAGVPESIIDKIRAGQNAVATIDALPDVVLEANVQKVSVVPDQSRWWDSSNKTYTVTLDIPTTPTVALKPGMSVAVEILTGELKDALHVPIQAVLTEEDVHYVFLVDGSQVKKTRVEIGENNEESIQITSGLKEGQEVMLYAPVEAETRAGLKERPLEKAKKAGKEVKPAENLPPATPPAPAAETANGENGRGEGPRPGGMVPPGGRPEGSRPQEVRLEGAKSDGAGPREGGQPRESRRGDRSSRDRSGAAPALRAQGS